MKRLIAGLAMAVVALGSMAWAEDPAPAASEAKAEAVGPQSQPVEAMGIVLQSTESNGEAILLVQMPASACGMEQGDKDCNMPKDSSACGMQPQFIGIPIVMDAKGKALVAEMAIPITPGDKVSEEKANAAAPKKVVLVRGTLTLEGQTPRLTVSEYIAAAKLPTPATQG